MHLDLVPVLLHFSLVPAEELLVIADKGVVLPVGSLLLLPLHGVLLGPVLVHLSWEDIAPPDVKLVLSQLTLDALLLGVGTPEVVLGTW
jgi:hypothetical protein